MNTRSLYKKRNITHKTYKYFKENIHKYLSPAEQNKLPATNDMLKYLAYPVPPVKLLSTIKSNKERVTQLAKKIRSHIVNETLFYTQEYPEIKVEYSKTENYKRYFIKHNCKEYDILNINALGKRFTYFNMTPFMFNPSETHMLFGVDFIGNRCYHLFIKSLYSNEIKEININMERVVATKDLLGNSLLGNSLLGNRSLGNRSHFSTEFTWLNDNEIIYIAQNKYYNDKGAYVYNIKTKSKYLFAKIPHGYFGGATITADGNYVIFTISDYNSDEIYIMDSDSKLKLNIKLNIPIFKRTFSVSYPYIEHTNGEWIIHEQNKGINCLKRTHDFKSYTIDYINKNPNEYISNVTYTEGIYIFTLVHLKGCKLYSIKCNKLHLHIDEPTGYIKFSKLINHKFDYYTGYYLTKPVKSTFICAIPEYYEKKIYIRKDFYFTVLSKSKPHLSKCLLFGYGSYNVAEYPNYSPHYKALIMDGWTIVISHLRGGGEYGYKGYDAGRLTNQKNTFLDFIETADYLVKTKITTRKKLAIWGRSAGGLLITNVLNMRPDLCEFAIIGVPFVSPIETMKTFKTPLGIESRTEFGNPNINSDLDKIKEYAPIQNIDLDKLYPNIFIYTNYYDTLVPYTEPLAYYNAIKKAKVFTNNVKEVNLFIDNKYGHTQGSSLDTRIDSYAVIFDQLYNIIH